MNKLTRSHWMSFLRLVVCVTFVLSLGSSFAHAAGSKVLAVYVGMFSGDYDATLTVRDQIPWTKIDRVYIAFATLKDGALTDIPVDGSVAKAQKRIKKLVALCREANPSAEIFIVSNYGIDPEYVAAAEQPDRFADSVLAYLQRYGLDGFDMDWETTDIDDHVDELKTLLSTTYARLKAAGSSPVGGDYQLTHTIWPGVHSPATVAAISDYVDQFNLMTYGTGDGNDLATYAAAYADAGVPYEQMLAGVEGEVEYPENGGHDTPASIAQKADFVSENNLAGMFVWRMDNDMRTTDGETSNGPPTFQVTNWVYDALTP